MPNCARGRACKRRLHVQLQSHSDVRLHPVYRPSAAHRAGSMPRKTDSAGRRFRLDQEHKKLAAQLDADAIGAISGGAWRAGGYMN